MFGRPKAPVGPEARAWVAESMRRFQGMFEAERLGQTPVVEPAPEFFPDDFLPTEPSVRATLHRVCGFMRVDPVRLRLVIADDERHELRQALSTSLPHWESADSGAAGLYMPGDGDGQTVIVVKQTQLRDPVALIATLAHELGHVLLLGEGRIARGAEDMEPLTDLVTVFCGMGIFTANSAARFSQHDDGVKHGWSFQRLGYLSEPLWGYALAYFAALRGEPRPAWARHLNVNVGTYFRQSLKYLTAEGRPGRHNPPFGG